jgi:hypothetical protein
MGHTRWISKVLAEIERPCLNKNLYCILDFKDGRGNTLFFWRVLKIISRALAFGAFSFTKSLFPVAHKPNSYFLLVHSTPPVSFIGFFNTVN